MAGLLKFCRDIYIARLMEGYRGVCTSSILDEYKGVYIASLMEHYRDFCKGSLMEGTEASI